MKVFSVRRGFPFSAVLLVLATGSMLMPAPGFGQAAADTIAVAGPVDDGAGRDRFDEVTMRITHRIYPSFVDTLTVAPGEAAVIGDSEFSFEVAGFLADFGIKADGTLVSRSSVAHNPAFEVVVYESDDETDRQWAFFGTGKPHYRRNSLLAFEVLSFRDGDMTCTQPVPREESAP